MAALVHLSELGSSPGGLPCPWEASLCSRWLILLAVLSVTSLRTPSDLPPKKELGVKKAGERTQDGESENKTPKKYFSWKHYANIFHCYASTDTTLMLLISPGRLVWNNLPFWRSTECVAHLWHTCRDVSVCYCRHAFWAHIEIHSLQATQNFQWEDTGEKKTKECQSLYSKTSLEA